MYMQGTHGKSFPCFTIYGAVTHTLYGYLNFSKLRIKLGLKPLEVPDSTEDKGEKSHYLWHFLNFAPYMRNHFV